MVWFLARLVIRFHPRIHFSTVRVLIWVSDTASAELLDGATSFLKGVAVSVVRGGGAALMALAAAVPRPLIVHDLAPDPRVQLACLQRIHRRIPGASFFLLLPPDGEVILALARYGVGLPIIGVEVRTTGSSPGALAQSLYNAVRYQREEGRLWEHVARWPLPSGVRFLMEAELRFAPRNASLEEVLQIAGIGYEHVRRQAAKAGLPPPKKLLEGLRLLRAVSALEMNKAVGEVARTYGFRDRNRFQRRMRHHFLVTPTEARAIGSLGLLQVLEQAWFGDTLSRPPQAASAIHVAVASVAPHPNSGPLRW